MDPVNLDKRCLPSEIFQNRIAVIQDLLHCKRLIQAQEAGPRREATLLWAVLLKPSENVS